MRLLSLILSAYMLVLSLAPCTDGVQHEHIQNACDSEIIVDNHNHSDHNHDHQDTCPPFCVCACCGSIVVIPSQIFYKAVSIQISSSSIYDYQSNYSFEFHSGVWHPPTLS
jgi:ABC-type nickel/cobalt efflux system permease component RcnA